MFIGFSSTNIDGFVMARKPALPGWRIIDRKKRDYEEVKKGRVITRAQFDKMRSGVPRKKRMKIYEDDFYNFWEVKFKKKGKKIEPFSDEERLINELTEVERRGKWAHYKERSDEDTKERERIRIELYESLDIHEPWMDKGG